MILFLNKKDLFEEKIKKLSLIILFLSYGDKLKNTICAKIITSSS